MTTGIIGCGNMGGGMVRRLLGAGQPVMCFDPNPETLAQMQTAGATTTASVTDLAEACQTIILSLPKAAVVEAVMVQIADRLAAGAVILDASTSEPATSQKLSAIGAQKGFHFIDGPVSGGPAAANAGTMTMLLAGDRAVIESLRPILDVITAKTVFVGASGAGHAAKIANNMLCAANLVLVAEAVRMGKAAGVAAEDLLEGINAGSGRSGVSEVNFPKWVLNEAFDSGFTMGLMRKDVGLAVDLAAASGVDMPGFAPIADIWTKGSAHVPDDADFNEIIRQAPEDQPDV